MVYQIHYNMNDWPSEWCGSYSWDEVNKKLEKEKTAGSPQQENKNKKENKTMDFMKNVHFGKYTGNKIAFSIKGLCFRKDDYTWVAWDTAERKLVDVNNFNFNLDGLLYMLPAALNQIQSGDLIIYNNQPVFVESIEDNALNVINPTEGTKQTILPEHNLFGFDFVTKIVDLSNGALTNVNADKDNPFGNMLPFILLQDNANSDNLLPLVLMSQGNFDMNNPLMLMAFAKNSNMGDILPLMLLSQNGGLDLFSKNKE